MNLAKISVNGQLTLPAEIRRLLNVKAGDEVLLCSQCIEELREVIGKKAPQYLPDIEVFLAELVH